MSVPDAVENRKNEFAEVYQYYCKLYNEFKQSGLEPYRMTNLGAWATSRAPHVLYFFRNIDLSKYNLFLDLGSGDGIVSCIAGLFTQSMGIEVDLKLCLMAEDAARNLRLDDRVGFVCGNYLDQNLEKADCLYLYPDKPFDLLAEKLVNWRGTLLVYGPHLPPKAIRPSQTLRCGKEQMVVYRNH